MTSLTWKVAVVCTVRAVIIFLSGKNAFTNQNKSTSWGMTSNQYILSFLNYVYFMRTVGGERQITRLKLTIVQCETRIMERYSLFSWLFFFRIQRNPCKLMYHPKTTTPPMKTPSSSSPPLWLAFKSISYSVGYVCNNYCLDYPWWKYTLQECNF